MLQKLKNRSEGFTIIEVMIVLAIAGLIILIVFRAVPALQRQSRNTQRKNDVSNLLGAVAEYTSNNGGKLPTTNTLVTDNAKLSFFDPAQVTVTCQQALSASVGSSACSASTPTPPGDNDVRIVLGAKCSDTTTTVTGASSRNVAVLYKVEGSSASSVTCTES